MTTEGGVFNIGSGGGGEHAQVVSITVFVAVLCLCMLIGHLLEENRWVNESITAIIVGCITGMIILLISKGRNSHILRFNEELFFIYLLPPIIFNAGFQVKKKQFFQNFLTIMMFGVIGVFVSTSIIAAGSWWLLPKIGLCRLTARDYLGTIFSSTDTVLHQDETPLLYSLVFGEGVVNDATSVVLFNAIQKLDVTTAGGWYTVHVLGDFLYLFTTSTTLGIVTGLLIAYTLKTFYFGRHSTDREIALMILIAYLSYMLAELLHLSGILTVFFCGIVMSHYAWHNITESSRITTRHIFASMSFIAETFIFLYVGMDVFDIEQWKITNLSLPRLIGVCGALVFLILLGRAAFVFPLSTLANFTNRRRMERSSSITFSRQFTNSGVTLDPVNATMVTSTVIVVLFTTLVFGLLTKPLINYLVPHQGRGENHDMRTPKDELDLPLLSMDESTATNLTRAKDSLSMLLERPVYTVHHYWRRFDNAYMRPIFGGLSSTQRR
ncbi:Sodium/hydrogen exchanger 4-like protein [Drosera capensis]